MKKTAVEILEISLLGIVSFDSEVLRNEYKERFKIAEEMEKEQIVNAFDTGHRIGAWNFLGEEYYEKNFKNETK